ncbi:hypothetical protein M758_12G080300 [Ceratodon purpureus]|nr:hypothetical protein M758_12G080300 [Ceratodon purpureus]
MQSTHHELSILYCLLLLSLLYIVWLFDDSSLESVCSCNIDLSNRDFDCFIMHWVTVYWST